MTFESRPPKVALLCSGLGNIHRGHEVFARGLFDLLGDALDITLFKGGGEPAGRERVIPHIPRNSPLLDHIRLPVSPKWHEAAQEQERLRVEGETFAYAALGPLLEGGFDVIHCLEQEVCNVIYGFRHLFPTTPRIVFSNGGAIPAQELPRCDFVQEHTPHNFAQSARGKAFMIPHGVDMTRFNPQVSSDFRARHGIPDDAFVVLSVGTICYWHKRMDYVIREVAALDGAYLVIAGQESRDSPEIMRMGRDLLGERVVFATLSHDELPQAYAAADVFALGSLFETFGIVYIEAMACGLPVICTGHENQRSIVQEGIFIDMSKPGALTAALRDTDRAELARIGAAGHAVAARDYDLARLKERYLAKYGEIAAAEVPLPRYSVKTRLAANLRNAGRGLSRLIYR